MLFQCKINPNVTHIYTNLVSSENLYLNQKKLIKEIKQNAYNNSTVTPYTQEETKNAKKLIIFNNQENHKWLYSIFSTNLKHNLHEEQPIIVNENWSETTLKIQKEPEIRNLIFQTEDIFNYSITNLELKGKVNLKSDSSFWIFLHSKNFFTPYTAVIVFTKEEFSQRVHISLGTFFRKNNELIFRTLKKEELIHSKDKRNSISFEREDTVQLKMKIFDNGSENIKIIVSLNDNDYQNEFYSNFFLPVPNEKCKIMLAGSGHQCKVINFYAESVYNEKYAKSDQNNDSKDNQDCCLLF